LRSLAIMDDFLKTDIKFLKGVGPARADDFAKELGICTIGDLLQYYPYRYIDRTKIYRIKEINSTQAFIQLRGRITSFHTEGSRYKQRLVATFADQSGNIELIWFQGIKWAEKTYALGM
jgi:ATP-dependent DNA helicase RecG